MNRRVLLQAGAASLFGLNVGTPFLLGRETRFGFSSVVPDELSLILVWLKGGLSTIDTLDMKPHAPAEIRGEFDPISTVVPGIQICEHLPRLAAQADLDRVVPGRDSRR